MTRLDCLTAASEAVSDRGVSYGAPEDSFGAAGDMWSVILKHVLMPGHKIEPWHVALCMDALKTARLITNPAHRDSWVDKAGYAACGYEIMENRDDRESPIAPGHD